MKVIIYVILTIAILISTTPLLAQELHSKIITDGHIHTGFISDQGIIEINNLEYFIDRDIKAFIYAMPVDRSNTKDLLSRITQEVEQIRQLAEGNSCLRFVETVDQNDQNVEDNKISILLGIEYFNGVFHDSIGVIEKYKHLGIRYITLINNSYDRLFSEPNRLSLLGRQVIEKMNDVGILIDISHLNNQQRLVVLQYSKAPVIASHSCTLKIAEVEGNLSNKVIQALSKNKGYVMVSFNKNDLYGVDNPSDDGVELFINHIDYISDQIGIDHIGIGSDYQANGRYVPTELNKKDVFVKIFQALTLRGYKNDEINGILGGNILKVIY